MAVFLSCTTAFGCENDIINIVVLFFWPENTWPATIVLSAFVTAFLSFSTAFFVICGNLGAHLVSVLGLFVDMF